MIFWSAGKLPEDKDCSINEPVGSMRGLAHPWVRQEFEPDLRDVFPEMKAKEIRITIKGTAGCQVVLSRLSWK